MEPSDNEQAPDDGETRKVTNDEELTPLNWLHDKNLLKGKFDSLNAMKVKFMLFCFQESICLVPKCNHRQIWEMAALDQASHLLKATQSMIRVCPKTTIPLWILLVNM